MSDIHAVKFLKKWNKYNVGEVAGFPIEKVQELCLPNGDGDPIAEPMTPATVKEYEQKQQDLEKEKVRQNEMVKVKLLKDLWINYVIHKKDDEIFFPRHQAEELCKVRKTGEMKGLVAVTIQYAQLVT